LKQTKIYRCGIKKLSRYYNLRFGQGQTRHPHFYFLALKYIWFIDFFSAWYFECRKAALEIAIQENIEAVFTTSPPHSVHLFGRYVQKRLSIPWIMDLRDAMVDEPNRDFSKLSSQIQAKIETFYESNFYQVSDAIISVSQPILDSLSIRHPSIDCKSKSHLITNGFDETDFETIQPKTKQTRPMAITYTGAFLDKRTPKYFLDGVTLLVSKGDIDSKDLLIQFIGYFDDKISRLLASYAALLPIHNMGYQPHMKTLEYQVDSDVLLLIIGSETNERGGQIFTGKFFEYMGAGKTIFALAPDGPLKETIKDGNLGQVAPPKDVLKIAAQFKTLYHEWKNDKLPTSTIDNGFKKQYTRKYLTSRLTTIIKSVLDSDN
jgi:glycosyltransferase involved in cell wall biosynthesis